MSDDRNFDPRFDPAFQRGYEGVVDSLPQRARSESAARGTVEALGDYAQLPSASIEPASLGPASPDPALPGPVSSSAMPMVEEISGDDPLPLRINPFAIAIAILSVLLVGAGFYLIARMPALYADSQNSTGFDFVTLQVLIGAAPLAIVLGLATAIGLLFMLAQRWDRRR